MARLSWPGWLHDYWDRSSVTGSLTPDTVTHPSTNWAWCRVTSLIETNALTTTPNRPYDYDLWRRGWFLQLFVGLQLYMNAEWLKQWIEVHNDQNHANVHIFTQNFKNSPGAMHQDYNTGDGQDPCLADAALRASWPRSISQPSTLQ